MNRTHLIQRHLERIEQETRMIGNEMKTRTNEFRSRFCQGQHELRYVDNLHGNRIKDIENRLCKNKDFEGLRSNQLTMYATLSSNMTDLIDQRMERLVTQKLSEKVMAGVVKMLESRLARVEEKENVSSAELKSATMKVNDIAMQVNL